jgi:hypothetical protein
MIVTTNAPVSQAASLQANASVTSFTISDTAASFDPLSSDTKLSAIALTTIAALSLTATQRVRDTFVEGKLPSSAKCAISGVAASGATASQANASVASFSISGTVVDLLPVTAAQYITHGTTLDLLMSGATASTAAMLQSDTHVGSFAITTPITANLRAGYGEAGGYSEGSGTLGEEAGGAAAGTTSYFSVNGGVTNLDNFAPAGDTGDRAASAGADSNDACAPSDSVNVFSATDIAELNVPGYSLTTTTSPAAVSSGSGVWAPVTSPSASAALASAADGLNAPAPTFVGTPDVGSLSALVTSLATSLPPAAGIEERDRRPAYGLDSLTIDLSGRSGTLEAFDAQVNGTHAIVREDSGNLSHGVVPDRPATKPNRRRSVDPPPYDQRRRDQNRRTRSGSAAAGQRRDELRFGVPGKQYPGVLRHFGDETVHRLPPSRLRIDAGEMRLG